MVLLTRRKNGHLSNARRFIPFFHCFVVWFCTGSHLLRLWVVASFIVHTACTVYLGWRKWVWILLTQRDLRSYPWCERANAHSFFGEEWNRRRGTSTTCMHFLLFFFVLFVFFSTNTCARCTNLHVRKWRHYNNNNISMHGKVLIAPGGGYHNLAWSKEGLDVAALYNSFGVSAFVLKYRWVY